MKNRKEKPTTVDIVKIVLEAIAAIAALITAVRWW